jgi:hypothetical protein
MLPLADPENIPAHFNNVLVSYVMININRGKGIIVKITVTSN